MIVGLVMIGVAVTLFLMSKITWMFMMTLIIIGLSLQPSYWRVCAFAAIVIMLQSLFYILSICEVVEPEKRICRIYSLPRHKLLIAELPEPNGKPVKTGF
jgi:hypothetical protein